VIAATNPDNSAMTFSYAWHVVVFIASLGIYCVSAVWLMGRYADRRRPGPVERWLDRRIAARRARARLHAALANGDRHVLRAVTEREQSHRERVAVPRQLTARSPR
jgi:hypothetical protein